MAIKKQYPNLIFTISFLLFTYLHCSTPSAQAPAPAPPTSPPNIIKILKKANQYTFFVRLLKSTQVSDRLIGELRDPDDGKTIFAPTDKAFTNLKSGPMNSLNDNQRVEPVLFHVVPVYIPLNQFQTVSSPMTTHAGDSGDGEYPLNVTTAGKTVTLMTGLMKTRLVGTIYSDGQLAIYRVDQVLQPLQIFSSRSSGPTPAPGKAADVAEKSRAPGLAMHNFALFAVSVIVLALSL
ncbi:Fasciclin-like arabinogalactan protein 12 [Hibiscus syriacus]|uniref:Fasciclin-like arabinogalactan protein 12 n=1 Tax=Hibiscus syriacus TaxID=106335 RepID=A0A6A3A2F4_HIBSY|nr:fasciclin-like arabinogalactan protein 12 [Hibiscus syriacus]KAE8697837.1 Fasciclin-like arabinogalactan protein 12 [Hibiscus syriacus]